MALSILFNRKVEESIAGVNIDTNTDEIHGLQSVVTAFPIEKGSSISDNILNEPETLAIDSIISDNPIEVFRIGSDLVDKISGQDSRSKSAAMELMRINREKQTFTVVTGLKVYEDMAFTNLEFKFNKDTGKSVRFSTSFSKVNKVQSRTVAIDRDQLFDEFKDQASLVDEGKQIATELGPNGSSVIFDQLAEPLRNLIDSFLGR